MKLTATDTKALGWYVQDRRLRPQLSTPPTMYFTDKDGNSVTDSMFNILALYKAWNEEDKKERARQKRVADKKLKAEEARKRIL